MTVTTRVMTPSMRDAPLESIQQDVLEAEPLTELLSFYNVEDLVIDDERLLCDLDMLLQGAFEPLHGFMTLREYLGVVNDMMLPGDNVFPIPIVMPVYLSQLTNIGKRLSTISHISSIDGDEELPDGAPVKRQCTIRDKTQAILATMEVKSIFRPNLDDEMMQVLGTTDANHPYVSYLNRVHKTQDVVYIGGPVTKHGEGVRHFDFLKYRQTAKDVRESFKDAVGPVVGFQTRNPMHRAHFELTCDALRRAKEETGQDEATLLLTPAMGPTQPGDISSDVRLRCYSAILPYYKKIYGHEGIKEPNMVILPLAMRMAGPREALWHAIIRRNYGCTHFIVGRDHAGPSSKNANGEAFYGPYDAHELMIKYEDKLGIKPILARMITYVGEENGGYLPIDKIPPGVEAMNISGTEFRKMVENKEAVPEWFGFKEAVAELRAHYRKGKELGLVLYFTGLPCSGKSTVANAVDAALRERIGETRKVTILDADIIRTHLSKGLGFSREDRSMNVRRIGFVASEVAKHGGICLVANIAPFKEDREVNRRLIESSGGVYIEVHVDTDVDLCESRDVKGLYAKARAGQIKDFTGVNDPYEVPENPEIRVPTNCALSESLDRIMKYLEELEYI